LTFHLPDFHVSSSPAVTVVSFVLPDVSARPRLPVKAQCFTVSFAAASCARASGAPTRTMLAAMHRAPRLTRGLMRS